MPRDLFGEVVHPTAGLGSRKWYTLPLSLVFHTLALAVIVVVPLMAAGVLPTPARGGVEWTQVVPVAPPELPVAPRIRPATAPTLAVTNPDAAPVEAPRGVGKETGLVPVEVTSAGVEGGLPEGIVGTGAAAFVPAEAPPPPAPVAPIRLHSGIRPPTKIRNVAPIYPEIAQRARVQGVVILEAIIGVDGTVKEARVIRSIPLLDQPALDAVRQWAFTPTLLNSVPVAVIMTVTVTFALK